MLQAVAIRNSRWLPAQAWKHSGLDAATLDLDEVGIYLGSGEGSLDFDAFTTANLAAWQSQTATLDTVKWAELREN